MRSRAPQASLQKPGKRLEISQGSEDDACMSEELQTRDPFVAQVATAGSTAEKRNVPTAVRMTIHHVRAASIN